MTTNPKVVIDFYYAMFTCLDNSVDRVEALLRPVRIEVSLLLPELPDNETRCTVLQAKRKAVAKSYTEPPAVGYLLDDYEHRYDYIDSIRKWEEHEEIKALWAWLQERAPEPWTEEVLTLLQHELEEELILGWCQRASLNYLDGRLRSLESQMALAAGQRLNSGLGWNLTRKAPHTLTDFENLMSALWDAKFITHESGSKEQALRALYGIFGLEAPKKIGTNRHKAKAAGTTTDESLNLFDRLKAAHQAYLDRELR